MKFISSLTPALKRPATYILFVLLLASTLSTRWLNGAFDSCGSSPESPFELEHCFVDPEGKTRFQNFDLTDTPTSALRLLETPLLTDHDESLYTRSLAVSDLAWSHNTYVLYGSSHIIVSLLEGLFWIIDVAYLFFISSFVVSHWKQWKRGKKITAGIILGYLYFPVIFTLILAGIILR